MHADYPRQMFFGPTANLVSGQLVACYGDSCEIYNNGQWNHLAETKSTRYDHSSAVKEDRILLIGGFASNSTEWISMDGSPSMARPFDVSTIRHALDNPSYMTGPINSCVLFSPFGQMVPWGHMDNYGPIVSVIYLHL